MNDEKKMILVVDDTPENIDVLSGILRNAYKVKVALNGEKALKIANADTRPSMILLDIMMPGMDGYEVCQKLKANPLTAPIPVIFITARNEEADEARGLELGAVDYITKPVSPAIVLARVQTHLALHDQNMELERKVRERTEQLNQTRLEIIQRLGIAAELKDYETGLHVTRMSHYSRLLAQALTDDEAWVDLVFNAAPMHDIGKIGVPDGVLLKPGSLDDGEWDTMRLHPEYGAKILGAHDSDLMRMARDIALTHHEKWDGSGYPGGRVGEDIPLASRIVALADVFDALTTQRPYKPAWSVEDAVSYIDENSGSHFDPKVVDAFHRVLPQVLQIREQYTETNAQEVT